MRFCISFIGHGPGAVTLNDYRAVITDGLQQLGHEVLFSPDRLARDAMNIVFEAFQEPLLAHLRENRPDFLIVATEHPSILADGTIRLNQRTDPEFLARSAGLVEAVKLSKGVFTLWPSSEEWYRQYAPCSYWEFGYSEALAAEYAAAATGEPDLDYSFAGVLTDYRIAILDRLQQAGLTVGHIPGLRPVAERNRLIMRSKRVLCLRQNETWPMGSASRVAGALHAARLPVQECVPVETRPCDLVSQPEPGRNFIDHCRYLADRSWDVSARVLASEYRDRMPCRLTMERALDGVMASA